MLTEIMKEQSFYQIYHKFYQVSRFTAVFNKATISSPYFSIRYLQNLQRQNLQKTAICQALAY